MVLGQPVQEVLAHVKQGVGHQRDEHAPHPAAACEEWMNRVELHVPEGCLDER